MSEEGLGIRRSTLIFGENLSSAVVVPHSELRAVSMPSDSQLEAPSNPPLRSIYPGLSQCRLITSLFALDRSRLFSGHCVIVHRLRIDQLRSIMETPREILPSNHYRLFAKFLSEIENVLKSINGKSHNCT